MVGDSDQTRVAAFARDSTLDALAVVMELFPFGGSFVGRLIDQIPRHRERLQQNLLASTAARLEAIQQRMDGDFVKSEEFLAFVGQALETGARWRELEKRRYFASAIASASTPDRPDEEQRWRMLDVLERLRPNHLALLARIAAGIEGAPSDIWSKDADQVLPELFPELGPDVAMLWTDLIDAQLVPEGNSTYGGGYRWPLSLSDFGARFVAFVGADPNADRP